MLVRGSFPAAQAAPGFTILSRCRWYATARDEFGRTEPSALRVVGRSGNPHVHAPIHTGNTRRRRRHLLISAGTGRFVTRKKAHRPGIHRMLTPGAPGSRPEWGRLHRDPAARPDASKEQVETVGHTILGRSIGVLSGKSLCPTWRLCVPDGRNGQLTHRLPARYHGSVPSVRFNEEPRRMSCAARPKELASWMPRFSRRMTSEVSTLIS
jgi:hypothetical protein